MLTIDEINIYRKILKSGGSLEQPKLELKRVWWNLDEEGGRMEFLKDTTGMANTAGATGYIILGLDEGGSIYHSPIPKGKYNDPAKIKDIVYSKVIEPFDIEFFVLPIKDDDGNTKIVTIVELPTSFKRPHVIGNYKTAKNNQIDNFIPIRKSTRIFAATKSDLDEMYFNRNLPVKPLFKLDMYVLPEFTRNTMQDVSIPINVLNNGVNINFIAKCELIVDNETIEARMLSTDFANYDAKISSFISIPSNDMVRVTAHFNKSGGHLASAENIRIKITDFKGQIVQSNPIKILSSNYY